MTAFPQSGEVFAQEDGRLFAGDHAQVIEVGVGEKEGETFRKCPPSIFPNRSRR
jgi:hypothetical protein